MYWSYNLIIELLKNVREWTCILINDVTNPDFQS